MITIHISWWLIPTIITVLSVLVAFFWPSEERDGFFGSLYTLMLLLPGGLISLIAWIVAGFLK
jgi:hypothetical protein